MPLLLTVSKFLGAECPVAIGEWTMKVHWTPFYDTNQNNQAKTFLRASLWFWTISVTAGNSLPPQNGTLCTFAGIRSLNQLF